MKANEQAITKNQILSELSRSPHGKLEEYVPLCKRAADEDPEFLARLIAWDKIKGQVRDAKVALPVITLTVAGFRDEFVDNSLAHMALLGPREFLRAYHFAMDLKPNGRMRTVRRLATSYLRHIESSGRFDRTVVQHRSTLRSIYALVHERPQGGAPLTITKKNPATGAKEQMETCLNEAVLFWDYRPKGSIFEAIANLKDMNPQEAAGTILERKIPFLIALGALGAKAKEPDLVLALIERMSPTELVTNTKMLEKLGIKTVPSLRAAYQSAVERVGKSKKATFKTTRAAEAVQDEGLKAKLSSAQEKQIKDMSIDGNWLVLGDKSGSMVQAIETSRLVSATLAKMVSGTVTLVFFDSAPQIMDVTGKTYEEVKEKTRYITANGGTSIGCGLLAAVNRHVEIDGIAIVSDGGENTPPVFIDVYRALCKSMDKDIPVYLYRCPGEGDVFSPNMKRNGLDVQVFDMEMGVDYYSLPDLVKTMRVNRYSLIEEIMETPLLSLSNIFKGKEVMTDAS
jgi:hypothetical protein